MNAENREMNLDQPDPKVARRVWVALGLGGFSLLCLIGRIELDGHDFSYYADREMAAFINNLLFYCQFCGECALVLGIAAARRNRFLFDRRLGIVGAAAGLLSSAIVYPFLTVLILGPIAYFNNLETITEPHFGGLVVKVLFHPELSPGVIDDYSPGSRIKGDLRTIAIGLETYYLDHKDYPAWSVKKEENANGGLPDRNGVLARVPTFRISNGNALATLTTPAAYMTSLYADGFAPFRGATFGYWNNGTRETPATGYIIWSAGPDHVYDLTIDNIAQAYDPKSERISDMLLNFTYDPSNGTPSRGDVYRVKQ